jgi:hypothetical protein
VSDSISLYIKAIFVTSEYNALQGDSEDSSTTIGHNIRYSLAITFKETPSNPHVTAK